MPARHRRSQAFAPDGLPIADLRGASVPQIGAQVWRTTDGSWRFDGPASLGPPEVRQSGRGPYYVGETTERHVAQLLRRAASRGYAIRYERER